MDCNVQNVIYRIKCKGCNEDYIGETGNLLRHRITVHNQQITHEKYRQIPLSKHLDICNKTRSIKYSVMPFYKLSEENILKRREKETYFIKLFSPKLNA